MERRTNIASSSITLNTGNLKTLIETTLDENKAENIVTIDLAGKSSFADYMVVASGLSHRHVGALADRITRTLKDRGVEYLHVEGMELCDWVLIDAGDIVVHIFRPEIRGFYNLEKMWAVPMPSESLAV